MTDILTTIQIYMVTAFILFLLIIFAGITLYALNLRKKHSISEINYDTFRREDVLEYLKFDDIVSSEEGDDYLKGAGAVIVNKRTYVAAISVTGYNFYTASYDSQLSTINAVISFMNFLEFPISLRQTVKQINISHNIEEHEKLERSFIDQIEEKEQYIKDLIGEAEDCLDDNAVYAENLFFKAESEERILNRLRHQLAETRQIISYMKSISSESGDTQRVQTIVYSYTFDAAQFTTHMSDEEVDAIALQELENRASQITSGLFRMGCSGKRLSARELVELMRRYTHPATADEVSVSELFQSDIEALFVTSESILDVVRDRLGAEEYLRQTQIWEEKLEELKRSRQLINETEEDERLQNVYKVARKQLADSM